MASVRMCDQCGTIFSERAEDWSTFTGTTRRRDPDTKEWRNQTDTLDACPECTERMSLAARQRPQLPTSLSPRYEPGPLPSGRQDTAGG